MQVQKLNSNKIPAGQKIWQVIDGGKTCYRATLERDFVSKGWKLTMMAIDSGAAVLHAHAQQTPSDATAALVLERRARDLKDGETGLLGVAFDEYATYAGAARDEMVKNPKRFIITTSAFGPWTGTIADLLTDEASYQRAFDYLSGHELLDADRMRGEDDYPSLIDLCQAMTWQALLAACDGDTVYVSELEGDVIETLDTLQATIEAYDGTEREVALDYQSQIVTSLVDDTDNIALVAAVTDLDREHVLECIRRARA